MADVRRQVHLSAAPGALHEAALAAAGREKLALSCLAHAR